MKRCASEFVLSIDIEVHDFAKHGTHGQVSLQCSVMKWRVAVFVQNFDVALFNGFEDGLNCAHIVNVVSD